MRRQPLCMSVDIRANSGQPQNCCCQEGCISRFSTRAAVLVTTRIIKTRWLYRDRISNEKGLRIGIPRVIPRISAGSDSKIDIMGNYVSRDPNVVKKPGSRRMYVFILRIDVECVKEISCCGDVVASPTGVAGIWKGPIVLKIQIAV